MSGLGNFGSRHEHRKGKHLVVMVSSSSVGNLTAEILYVSLHGSEAGRASGGITAPAGKAGTGIKNPDTFISGKMKVTGNPQENVSRWKERYVCIRDFWEDQSTGRTQQKGTRRVRKEVKGNEQGETEEKSGDLDEERKGGKDKEDKEGKVK